MPDHQATGCPATPVVDRIQSILEKEIRPSLIADGGDIQFDRYSDGVLYVRLRGACCGCPHAAMTLKMGVEAHLKERIPELKEVVSL